LVDMGHRLRGQAYHSIGCQCDDERVTAGRRP
jgi:hypothetical protein